MWAESQSCALCSQSDGDDKPTFSEDNFKRRPPRWLHIVASLQKMKFYHRLPLS